MVPSPDRLRVLMVVQRMLPYLAGAELQAVGLAGALGNLGVEVHFVSTRYAKGLPARSAVRGRAVRRLPVVRGPLLKPSQLVSTAAWVWWKARGFDLVHAHCLSAASLGASMGAQLAGVPVLVKPSLAGPDGETARLLGHPLARRLLGVLRRVSRFAALDTGVVDELTALGIEPHRIEAVDNGVDLRCFRPAAPGERAALRARFGLPAGPIAVFAGQLVARKGIAETIDAWRMIAPSLDDPLLIVAGDGPEEALVRRAAADPAAHIRYVGAVDEVADMMRASDAFVLPSRNESFGNAMLEAMASGLPVVVGRTGLAARLDIDPGAGRALDRPDAVRIASALREVLAAADRSAHLGVRGRLLAEGFDYARVARCYLDIYRSMIGRQPA